MGRGRDTVIPAHPSPPDRNDPPDVWASGRRPLKADP